MELFNAINNNELMDLHELLIDGANINEPLAGGMTPLHIASEKGYASCVGLLISAGADPNILDDADNTPLMNAVGSCPTGYPLVVYKLLKSNCNCNKQNSDGDAALHIATRLNYPEIMELLLDGGANVNLENNHQETPLDIAVKGNMTVAVQLLLRCNNYLPLRRSSRDTQKSLFFIAMENGWFDICKMLFLAGFPVWQESWIFNKNFPASVSNNSEVRSWLTQVALHPTTLQQSCRHAIRQLLGDRIDGKVDFVCLPRQLKDYVCFTDLPPVHIPASQDFQIGT